MARTAPAPNIPPIPGMCPGVAVLAGGGDGGGGSGGSGKKGKGKKGAGTGDGDEDASGDGKDGGEACGDPVCPITGRMMLDVFDFGYPGPLPLKWLRVYSSRASKDAFDIGHGWTHSFSWRIRVKRRRILVVDENARVQKFVNRRDTGDWQRNAIGWRLRRGGQSFELWLSDGRRLHFGPLVDGLHHLVAVEDPNGNRISIERDARGRITGLVDSAGRPYRVEHDPVGRIASIFVATDERRTQWLAVARYTYDADGNLSSFIDAEDYRWEYVYDGHLMVEHRIPTGLTYCYRYDGRTHEASCVESWGEYIGKTDPALEPPIPPRPEGVDTRSVKGIHYVRFEYLKQERYTEVSYGIGGFVRYFGDASGRVIKRVDSSGGISEYFYDPATGKLIRETQPDGTERAAAPAAASNGDGPSTFAKNNGARVGSYIDEDGLEVSFDEGRQSVVRRDYDLRGNVTYVEHDDGTTEQYDSDDRGLLRWSTDRLGVATRYVHDAMGNLIEEDRPGVGVQRMEYDYLGRKVAHVDPYGARTEWSWDRRNEVIEKRYADGGKTRYWRNALRYAEMIEHYGAVTRCQYGGLDWPVRVEEPDGTFRDLRYDIQGNLVRVINGRGDRLRQSFDHAGRRIALETFEGQQWTYAYDARGALIWRDGPLGREVREYDEEHRLNTVELPDGEKVEIVYDAAARKLTIDNGSPIERTLNTSGTPVREVDALHDLRIYWNAGAADGFVSDVGVPIRRTRAKSAGVATIEAGDDCALRFETRTRDGELVYLGDHLVLRRVYSAVGQLAGECLSRRDHNVPEDRAATSADPNVLWWSSYEWRGEHLVAERYSDGRTVDYELRGGRVVTRRAYDKGILVEEERVSYDSVGTPQVTGVRYDALGRPIEIDGEALEYNEAGHLVTRGDAKLSWSAAGELTAVETAEQTTRYRYDAVGRRIAKRVYRQNEVVRDVSYQWLNNCVIHEVEHSAARTRTYVRDDASFAPLAHVDLVGSRTEVAYYLRSPIGYPVAAVDPQGNVVWRANPTLYGTARPIVEKVAIDARFPNQHDDPDVGLVYNKRRWFDPRTGLFISPDPLELEGNLHPREYVPNPTIHADPSGLAPIINGLDHAPTSDDLLFPGPNAKKGTKEVPGFIDAGDNALDREFSADTRRAIDNAGFTYGCHSCGSTDPDPEGKYGYKHFVPDHQPPVSQSKAKGGTPPAGSVKLYPHCHRCSNAQKYQQANLARDNKANVAAAKKNQAAMKKKKAHPMPSKADMKQESDDIKANSPTPNNGWPDGF